jgi:hypothetical protein
MHRKFLLTANIPKDEYLALVRQKGARLKSQLRLFDYNEFQPNVNHFRHLLSELDSKQGFRPDMIIVDYLDECTSSELKTDT